MNGVTMHDLAGDRLRPHLADPEIAHLMSSDHAGGLDAVMRHDVGLFMVDDVLRKVDMMSMLASLEVRVPLLDLRVVEKSLAISWRDKISATQTKTLMRTYFAHKLPKDVVEGRKKGFAIPLDEWLRGPLRQVLEDTLLSERARQRGVLRAKEVARLVSEHSKGYAATASCCSTCWSWNGGCVGTMLDRAWKAISGKSACRPMFSGLLGVSEGRR